MDTIRTFGAFLFVILSSIVMGISEGGLNSLDSNYLGGKFGKTVSYLTFYQGGVVLYLVGFLAVPNMGAWVAAVWEISAVVCYLVMSIIAGQGHFHLTMIPKFMLLIAAATLMGIMGDQILSSATK